VSKNISQIPLTELVERTIEIARIREEVRGKVRGVINDVYVRDIPRCDDWMFFLNRTSLTIVPSYATGNATVTTGGTTVTFSGATIDSSMTGRKIKFTNADYVYNLYYVSPSDATISPALIGSQNISGGAFSIYQNVYTLPKDFDRFPKNGGMHTYQGGKPKNIPEKNYDYYIDQLQTTPNDNTEFCRVTNYSALGARQLEVIPPPMTQGSWEMDYLRQVNPLRELTNGTISISASGTSVSGSGTSFTSINTGSYLRVDAFGTSGDSEWYRIDSIASTSSLTIETAFVNSSVVAAKYTIATAAEMPESMHLGLLYGAITQISADQNDPMTPAYRQKYADVLSDNKKIYRTRMIRSDVPLISEEYHYRR
jgi:hypothetical protein